MVPKTFNQKTIYELAILSGILLLSSIFILVSYAESEQVVLDLYTQKGGQGVSVEGGTFGLGEAVRLIVQLNISPPTTVEEASEFFKTQVDFQVIDPDGSMLISRSEQVDLKGWSIIAFMLPSNAKAGTYNATATYDSQGQTATDYVTFTVDPSASFTKISRTGRIIQDETWSGTVYITGDLWTDTGITITILPGTTVFFSAHQDDQHQGGEVQEFYEGKRDPASTFEYSRSHVEINGKFIARGTPNDRIIFTSGSLAPNYADWQQLSLQPESYLEYCIVEYGRGCDQYSDGDSKDSSITISHSIFRHMFWGAIIQHYCSPKITYNYIYDVGHAAIEVNEGEGSAPTIANNLIAHTRCGIVLFCPRVFPLIENNILINNDVGIAFAKEECGGIVRYNLISSHGSPHDWVGYEGFTYKAHALRGQQANIITFGIESSSPTVTNNIIFDVIGNTNVAIRGDSSATLSYNTIFNGHTGIIISRHTNGTIRIFKNNIYDQDMHIFLDRTSLSIGASSNWWGTNDPSEIAQKIHDYYYDPTLGKVNYQPFEMGIVRAESVISISASRPLVTVGDVVTVSGSVAPPHGGAVVTLTYTKPDANVITRTVTTNFAGRFSDTHILDQLGSWSVKASWAGDEDHEPATTPSTLFMVEVAPAPTTGELAPQPQASTPTPEEIVTPSETVEEKHTEQPIPTETPEEKPTKQKQPGFEVISTVIAAVFGAFWLLKRKKV